MAPGGGLVCVKSSEDVRMKAGSVFLSGPGNPCQIAFWRVPECLHAPRCRGAKSHFNKLRSFGHLLFGFCMKNVKGRPMIWIYLKCSKQSCSRWCCLIIYDCSKLPACILYCQYWGRGCQRLIWQHNLNFKRTNICSNQREFVGEKDWTFDPISLSLPVCAAIWVKGVKKHVPHCLCVLSERWRKARVLRGRGGGSVTRVSRLWAHRSQMESLIIKYCATFREAFIFPT